MFREKKMQENHHLVVSLTMMMMTTTMIMTTIGAQNGTREIQVGVILDMDSYIGKSSRVCISMALEDFYDDNNGSTVIIRPHYRDPGNNDIQAASAAIDLLKNSQVMAILGPQQSSQANFILDIAEKSKVPMISSATSPDLSPNANNFFIRTAQASSTQAQPIAAIIKSFGWREVVLVFEDSDFGRGLIPYLSDAMENITTHVNRCILLPPSSSDDLINQQLQNLKTMQTRVFVVHMLPALASRFFKKADEARMMTRGSAWIITDVLTIHFNHLVPEDRKFMHGVIGVKPYIPPSKQLTHFHKRWRRRFQKEYPEMDRIFELDVFGIWWYDSVFALATSLQKVETELIGTTFKRPTKASTDLTAIGTSEMGASLVSIIRNTTLKGLLSGDFQVINGQLRIIAYEIVNVIEKNEKRIGFWNSKNGITSNQPSYNESMNYTTNKDDFGAIIWPGDSVEIPKGWEIPTSKDGKLRVGVPGAKDGFVELIHAEVDPKTNETKASGFCVDVFKAVVDALPYAIDYTFIPYGINDTDQSSGDYNHLVHQIVDQKFDMVVGDVTILGNRSRYVDFTTPYSESGVSMIVPVKVADVKSEWIFMRPFETKLWITTAAFFIYTGFVVWAIEHRVNKEFRGPRDRQIGTLLWFSFSTLVYSHKEKLISNLSRFVVIVWVFAVLVLTSSYTANLASMITLQSFEPTVTSIYELKARGDYVGIQDGSFVAEMLTKEMGFPQDKLKKYTNIQEYADALSKGSKKNGVSAIVAELPYLKMLQAKNYTKYSLVGPIFNTAGFGFAFPKGSLMVSDFSKAILRLIEDDTMTHISNRWMEDEAQLSKKDNQVEPFDKLKLDSFRGLFYIAGFSSTFALVVFLFKFMYENKEILTSQGSIYEKLAAIIRSFDEEKYQKSSRNSIKETIDGSHMGVEDHTTVNPLQSPIPIDHQVEGVISPGSTPIQ